MDVIATVSSPDSGSGEGAMSTEQHQFCEQITVSLSKQAHIWFEDSINEFRHNLITRVQVLSNF